MTDLEALPEKLKETARFCCWRYETVDGRKTKVPYNPNTGRRGDSSDPAAFSRLEAAARVQSQYDGLGVGVFNNLGAIDIDHCITDGKLSPLAADIMDTMESYTEISPSGEGLRILFTLPPGFKYDKEKYYIRNAKLGLEVYAAGMTNRFLTLTGNTLTPGQNMNDGGEALPVVIDKYMQRPQQTPVDTAPAAPLDISDSELIQKALASNDTKFRDLWAGDWKAAGYASQSEADAALCEKLAFWTGRDAGRIDTLFRQSGLMRSKWNDRPAYRESTIQKALAVCGETYNPNKNTITQSDREGLQHMKDNAKNDLNGRTADLNTQGDNSTPEPLKAVKNDSGAFEGVQTETNPERERMIEEYGPDMGPFLQTIFTERYKPVATGITGLDDFLHGGLIRQTLVLLSSKPGAGKTILASMILESMARQGIPCVYLNLEMSREQMLARSISRILYLDLNYKLNSVEILQGYNRTEKEKDLITQAARKYAAEIAPNMKYNPLETSDLDAILKYLDDTAAAAVKAGRPAPCVCIDYLHIITSTTEKDAGEIIKRAVQRLKEYASKYDTIVIAIEAQNRAANKSGKSDMAAGRDSSSLEYSGDLILQLKTGDDEDTEKGDPDTVKLYVNKSRFTAFDVKDYCEFRKHGGQSYFEQLKDFHRVPLCEQTPFDNTDSDTTDTYRV